MEWSWRTVLILIGLLAMVAILIDGFRRMRRARAEALRLDVSHDYRFPDDSHNPELPGGARVVNHAAATRNSNDRNSDRQNVEQDDLHSAQHDAQRPQQSSQQHDDDDALLGFRSAQQRTAEQERARHNAQEPVFTELEGNFSTEEEPVIPWEDDLGPARVVKSAVVVKPAAKAPVAESLPDNDDADSSIATRSSTTADDAEDHTVAGSSAEQRTEQRAEQRAENADMQLGHSQEIHANAAQARSEHRVEDLDIPPSPLIPKARPVNLDEKFPVLLDVEELGDDDIKPQIDAQAADEKTPASTAGNAQNTAGNAEGPAENTDTPSKPELAESDGKQSTHIDDLAEINDPHLEQEVDKLPSDLPLQPVNFAGANAERLASRGIPELVLEIHAIARDPLGFSGKDILFLFNSCDLRFGEKDIFHRFEQADGEGCIQFSVAQSYEPGIFVPAAMAQQHFRGLSFFMSLPGAKNPREAYEAMSEMALVVARKLHADVYDGARSALTPQTMEHDRQQIMDFERRQRLALKKQAK